MGPLPAENLNGFPLWLHTPRYRHHEKPIARQGYQDGRTEKLLDAEETIKAAVATVKWCRKVLQPVPDHRQRMHCSGDRAARTGGKSEKVVTRICSGISLKLLQDVADFVSAGTE